MQFCDAFLSRMQTMLGDAYDSFISTYASETTRGIRFNKLKTDGLPNISFDLGQRLVWCPDGFTYSDTQQPAKSVLHAAGIFYIQEPSAMIPAEILDVQPGMFVLDVCAAPGGKSTQIASHLNNDGFLLSNDLSVTRAKTLAKNMERAGVTCAVVLAEKPNKIAGRFPDFFDRILVDAPCSGEGMFRRDPASIKNYHDDSPYEYAKIQCDILQSASQMLKIGGKLVYSTCTFNTIENEAIIFQFLQNNPEFRLLPINHKKLGLSKGMDMDGYDASDTARVWPMRTNNLKDAIGEGHFIALLEKQGAYETNIKKTPVPNNMPKVFSDFCCENKICFNATGNYVVHESSLYLQPCISLSALDLKGLRVVRNGWHLGDVTKNGFMPSQALAMGLKEKDVTYKINLLEDDARRFLRGETLDCPQSYVDCFDMKMKSKPYVLIMHQEHPLGWAQLVHERLKNKLPLGWIVQ